jgi:metal-responsive CopG/Arc/MetJ family transcriptional regulator
MRTIRVTLDEELLASVDKAAKRLNITRSAFTRQALCEAVHRLTAAELEDKHREGYKRRPVQKGECDIWQSEQTWPGS